MKGIFDYSAVSSELIRCFLGKHGDIEALDSLQCPECQRLGLEDDGDAVGLNLFCHHYGESKDEVLLWCTQGHVCYDSDLIHSFADDEIVKKPKKKVERRTTLRKLFDKEAK